MKGDRGGRGEDERKGCGAKHKAVAVDQAVTCRPHTMLRRACLCAANAQVYLSCGYVYKVAWNRLSTLASLRMCSAFPWRPTVTESAPERVAPPAALHCSWAHLPRAHSLPLSALR